MTKAELIEKVQAAHGDLSRRQVGLLVDTLFEHLAKGIRKDKRFTMPGFGTFAVKKRAGRVGRNPRTGAEIRIAPTKTVGFKPAPELKKAL
jgi:DNA-binding protein HU-beta